MQAAMLYVVLNLFLQSFIIISHGYTPTRVVLWIISVACITVVMDARKTVENLNVYEKGCTKHQGRHLR